MSGTSPSSESNEQLSDAATIRNQAEVLSANCFFNALLREWQGWTLHKASEFKAIESYRSQLNSEAGKNIDRVINIPVNDLSLLVFISHFSITGRHQFLMPVILSSPAKATTTPITFMEAVQLLVTGDILWQSDQQTRRHFLQRVHHSVNNIETNLSIRQSSLDDIFNGPGEFQASEQSLLTGHSVHPCPKSRDQFSQDDAARYMPEFGSSFQLHWFAIDSCLLDADSVHSLSFSELTRQLAEEDKNFPAAILLATPEHQTLLPAHPWQAQQWLKSNYMRQLIQEKKLVDYGLKGSDWRATSSVRSIHASHASFMLKYSLSVKLTNSVRHLLPKEVIRGKEIHQVKYRTSIGTEMRQRYPDFEVITEPAHGAIKGPDGQILPETMMVLRENPFNNPQALRATELLASLTQDNPNGASRLVSLIRKLADTEQLSPEIIALRWFNQYLSTVVEPLMIGQSDFGLLFGAHQQNLLITLKQGYPWKVYFRDCQGTGYSHIARELLAEAISEETRQQEHHVDGELGNWLFTYYLIINSTFGVISALGAGQVTSETSLLMALREFLVKLRASDPRDPHCLDYILNSPELWSKGNFYCSYCDMNENTLENPLAVYHSLSNPLVGLSQDELLP
ncbi:IucA/IucC family siderophore biosynthesis protein [Endozoicomonas sp. YOMI1]|uniref:IucA/IucC family protein n=1 Tax=Endozoicomonas sp. YOMI1 TaxID=2828739 RepID=UPI0021482AD9|nr:IucA/IucC family protein [Endozoicomonas sp. YOMI1]